MLDIPFREYGYEVIFKTEDKELNELVRISTSKMDYSFKTNELKLIFNLYTGNIEKLRGLTVGMLVPVEIILIDPTHTVKYSLFECAYGKTKNFEIKDCSIHTDYNSGKLLEYVITLDSPKV